MRLPILVGAALLAQGDADFPARAAREIAALRADVTPVTWLRAHPADSLVFFARGLVRENHDRWCARASAEASLPGRGRLVRHAYFYPPSPPPSLMLPAVEGPQLLREQCRLGTIWLETAVADSPSGSALAARTRDAFTRVYGTVRPSPDAWFGRTPTDSMRRAVSRLPGAEAWTLGLHFFGAAGWRVPGRWQIDSAVVVSAFDAGLGGRPRGRGRGRGRVLAFAFLPLAELGSFQRTADRAEAAEQNTAALAAEAARLSGIDRRQADRLLGLLAAADSGYLGGAPGDRGALGSRAVRVLGDWIAVAQGLDASHRAAALLAADQALGSGAMAYVLAQDEDSARRRALQGLGAKFVRDELGGGYNYAHTWLDEARRLDPAGRVGQLATVALLRIGFNETGTCGGGEEPFRRVSAAGERLLGSLTDSALAAEVHVLVGDAYADVVALASGAGEEYADPSAYAASAPEARRKAIQHYREGIARAPGRPEARVAWLEAWRLLAGLPPTTTHFFCVYD